MIGPEKYTLRAVRGNEDLDAVLRYVTGAKRVEEYGAPPAVLECHNVPRTVKEAVLEAHQKGPDHSAVLLSRFFSTMYESYRTQRLNSKILIRKELRLGYLITVPVKFHMDYMDCVFRAFGDLALNRLSSYPVVVALHPQVLSFDAHCFISTVPGDLDWDSMGLLKLTGSKKKRDLFNAFERYLQYWLYDFLSKKAAETGRKLVKMPPLPPPAYFSRPAAELAQRLLRQGPA